MQNESFGNSIQLNTVNVRNAKSSTQECPPSRISTTAANLHGDQPRRRYYSARVCAIHKHSLFLHSHSLVRRQADMTGERSGAGPTALRAFRGTGVSHRQLPDSELRLRNF
ncbi:hypothetical protein O3G_MSEX013959 [Manduca sexta]|uniref:Uncharacterized protein n=1 Tax=Manduca sexta TaxID=7130 RepID=A0A922D065_MANSE|nr:hypothetical protein O3G_MSEX013959 [Manduca sexta]